jgi:tRNA 2-thiouridine synthesizing protein B
VTALHIVNKSPLGSDALDSCLAHMTGDCALLLIEDGVYAALAGGRMAPRLAALAERRALYALGPDLAARGLDGRPLLPGLVVIDHGGFVDLVAAHSAAQSWF